MPLVLTGATSGSVTVDVPSVAGTNTLTLPAQTATVATLTTPSFASTIGVGGATAAASGAGISFPATQSASSDANTLDDYEEGTWTPTIEGTSTAGTGTYSYQVGRYIKIGKQVTVSCYLLWTAHTGSGNLRFTNLPFTSENVTAQYSSASFYVSNIALAANNVMTASYIAPNTNYIIAAQTPVGGGAVSPVTLDVAGEVIYTITYFS
jgi:hypothetical protein